MDTGKTPQTTITQKKLTRDTIMATAQEFLKNEGGLTKLMEARGALVTAVENAMFTDEFKRYEYRLNHSEPGNRPSPPKVPYKTLTHRADVAPALQRDLLTGHMGLNGEIGNGINPISFFYTGAMTPQKADRFISAVHELLNYPSQLAQIGTREREADPPRCRENGRYRQRR